MKFRVKFLLGGAFLGLISLSALHAQNLTTRVDLEKFDEAIIREDLLQKLNAKRAEKGLHALSYHDDLAKAAKDQAIYNRKYNNASNEQSKRKKATPALSVQSFGGLFEEVEEYDLGLEVQTKASLGKRKRKKDPETYLEVSDYIVEEWVDERRLDEILFDERFYNIGFGFAGNHVDGILFASIVLGTEEYEKQKGFKYHKKSWKIAPYDRNICKSFERDFSYSSELFSDNLKINKRKIQFYYHDLSLIESMFPTNREMMAVDILFNDQFNCESGNATHPSAVYDGMMLKPIKKSKLLKGNRLKDQKEFSVTLGTLPAGIDTNDISLSLMIIQDKCACNKIPRNVLNGKNIRLLDINLVVDTISIAESVDSNARFLKFTIPFEKNKADYLVEDIKPFLDSIQLNRFNIKEIYIKAFSSIEGNPFANEELQKRRANSILTAIKEYQLQEVATKIETEENWDGFFESIKGSPYESEYLGKDHNTVRSIVNSDTLKYDLEPYLEDQRKAEITIFVESIYIDSLENEYLLPKFKKSLEDGEYIRAKALQTLLYRAVKKGEMDKSVLFEGEIPQFKDYLPLLNNRLAFELEFDEGSHSDSLIDALKMQVEAYLGIDPNNGHLNFNKQAIKLYYWAKDLNILIIDEENRIDQVRDFYRDIRKLYNTKIDNYYVNRLLLNYNIIAADYHYEKQNFKDRNRALKQVRKYVKKAKLDQDQTLTMARYFIFQMQIDWAVEIMLPTIRSGEYNEEFLLTFLSIAVYDEKHVKPEMLYKYLETASEKYPEGFCNMFGRTGMSIEFFGDLRIKDIYCANCDD